MNQRGMIIDARFALAAMLVDRDPTLDLLMRERTELIAMSPRHSMTTSLHKLVTANREIYGLGFTGIDLDFPLDLGRAGRLSMAMMDALYGRKRGLV